MKKSNIFYTIIVFIAIAFVFGCTAKVVNEPVAQPAQPVQPAPQPIESCTDGIQNQYETGIDCGGVCAACSAPKPEVIVPPVVENKVVSYSIQEDKLTQLKAKLTPSTKAVFLTNAYPSGLSVGDSYVFPYGIANTFLTNYEFKFEVKYQGAKDSSNNPIDGIDEKTILGWFANNKFENINLGKYEQAFIPVGVTVGEEIGPGKKTVPGLYNFALISSYSDYGYKQYDLREFAFRVK